MMGRVSILRRSISGITNASTGLRWRLIKSDNLRANRYAPHFPDGKLATATKVSGPLDSTRIKCELQQAGFSPWSNFAEFQRN
jgi:hypothetical protein